MKKIAFVTHGEIKNTKKLFTKIREAFKGDYEVDFFVTSYAGNAVRLAADAVRDGFNYIICIGGDGTLNEVANGIMQAKEKDYTNDQQIYVGVLPLGTGNDFAKTLGINPDIAQLKKTIDYRDYKIVDLGLAEFKNLEGKAAKRYFINITDIGMGGVVAEKLSKSSKFLGSTFTYQKAILTTLLTYRNKSIRASADSFTYEGKVMNFIIANGKYFGSGLGIAPDAVPYDQSFAIVIVGEVSTFDYLKNLGTIRKCIKVNHPQMTYKTAKDVYVDSNEGALAIDMDGEFIGYSPLKIKLVPGALRFLTPFQ